MIQPPDLTPTPPLICIIRVIRLRVLGITTVQLQQELYVHEPNKTHPTTSVLKAGDYQLTVNLVALPVLATYPLFRLLLAGSTPMARSTVLATATGGPLLRSLDTVSTTCTTMVVVAWVPATAARATGSTYGVYGLARAR